MPPLTRDRILHLLTWPAAFWIAYELLWYEQYKLTGNPGSVFVFQTLADWIGIGAYEKPFRLAVASAEILAAVLVLIPRTRLVGAALTMGVMGGAIFFHLVSPLGIDPYEDGGTLFKEACVTFVVAALILWVKREEMRVLLARLGVLRPAVAA